MRARRPSSRTRKPRPRPRPGGRSARVRAAVLQAAFAVLAEKGIGAFGIAEVAARAGVHETSIYRRWGTKSALALEAALHVAQSALAIPDTGSLRSDLKVLAARLVALLASPQGEAFLALAAYRQPEALAARRRYFRQRFELARVMFDRAVARGEFPRGADPIVFLEALVAPLYLRLIVTGEPIEDWPRDAMIDRMLAAYTMPRK